MAGFYGCLKIPDDPTMAEPLSEASGSLEVLEASDEGKKKSKFKALKKIFGKKKKKESEDAQGRRSLQPSLSSSSINNSSLNLVQEDEQPKSRAKGRMGKKSLSHDSVFMLELEPERSESKIYPSPEPQRGRSLERSRVSRTLPVTGSMPRSVSGALFEVMPHYGQRSGIWVAGSKITEIPPLRSRQPSVSPTPTGSDTISKDVEDISTDDESPKTPQKKALPQKMLTVEKIPPWRPRQASVSPTSTGSDTIFKDVEEISDDDESPKTPQKKASPKKMFTVEKIPPWRPRQPSVSPTPTGSDTVSKDVEEISADDESPKTPPKKALPKKMMTVEKIPPWRPRQPSISPTRTGSDTISKDVEEISDDDEPPTTAQRQALLKKMFTVEKIPTRRPHQTHISPTRTRSDTISKDSEEVSAEDESPKTPHKKALPKKMMTVEKVPPRRPRQPSVSTTSTGSDTVSKDVEEISADDEPPKIPQKKASPKKMLTMEKIPPWRPRQPSISPTRTGSDTVSKDVEEISADDEPPKIPQKKASPKKMLTMEKIPPRRPRQPSVSTTSTGSDTISKDVEEISADDEPPKIPQKKASPKKMLTMEKIPPWRPRQPSVSTTSTGSDTISKDIEEISADDEPPKIPQKKASPKKMLTVEKIPTRRSRQTRISPTRTRSDTISKDSEEVSADDESLKTPQKKGLPKKMLSVKKIPTWRPRQPSISPPRRRSARVSKDFEEISADDESPKTPPKKALPKKMSVKKIPTWRPRQPSISPPRRRSARVSKDFEEISADDESPKTPPEKASPKKMSVKKIQPLHPCQSSISPTRTASDKISKEFKEISVDDESLKTPQKKALPKKILTIEKIPPVHSRQPSASTSPTGSDTTSKDIEEISDDDESPTTPEKKALLKKMFTMEKIPPRRPRQPSISSSRTGSDTISKDVEEISDDDEPPTTAQRQALLKKMFTVEKIPPWRPRQPSISSSRTGSDTISKDVEEISDDDEPPTTAQRQALLKKMFTVEKTPPQRPRQPSISSSRTGSDTISKDVEEISDDDEPPTTAQRQALLKKMFTVEKIPPRCSRQPSISPSRTGSDTISKDVEEISDDDEPPTTAQRLALLKKMFTVEKIPPPRPRQPSTSPSRTGSDTISKDVEEISDDDEPPTTAQRQALLKKMFTVEKIPPQQPRQPSTSPSRTGSDTISKDVEEVSTEDESPTPAQKQALLKKMFTVEKEENSGYFDGSQASANLNAKISKIPPLGPRQPSINPTRTGTDTFFKEFEEISADDESSKTPQKRAPSQKMLTIRKSSFEPSSRPIRAHSFTSPSSPQLPTGLSIPVTAQGCLDSSAAQHRMAVNPPKQKKSLQETVKPEQEEPSLPLVSEDKSKTKPKAADQKKFIKESAGPSSQEESNETDIYKTTDQASNTDAAVNQALSWPAAYGRQRGKKESSALVKSECGLRGRSPKQSSGGLGLNNRAEFLPADDIPSKSPVWHLSLEKQVMEQPRAPQVETTALQELLSDISDMGRRKADLDFKARKASVSHSIPKDMEESVASGPSQYHEDWASGTKKSEARDSLLSVVKNPSTTQEDVMFSVAEEAQVCIDPYLQSEEEDSSSSLDSQSTQFKIESAQDISTICKEKPPGNVLQVFTASALAEGGSSVERLPPRSISQSLGKPEAEDVSSDSDSTLEVESGFEQQLAPGYTFQSSRKPKDEENSDSESAFSEEGSGSKQQLDPKYSFQSLRKPKDDQETFIKSSRFLGKLSSSHEQLAPRCASQALGEPEDKVSTESSTYLEKYSSAKNWSSSEEDLPQRHPFLALGKSTDQQEISSVSKTTLEEWGISVEQTPPRPLPQPIVKPLVQQEPSSGSMSASSEWEPMPPSHPFQPWLSPTPEQAGPGSTAFDWGIFLEPLPPRGPSKRLLRRRAKQKISSGPEIATSEGITPMELQPSGNSQPPVKQIAEQAISAGPESTAMEWGIPVEPLPPRMPSQHLMRPVAEQEVFSGSVNAPAARSGLVEPMPPRNTFQPWVSPEFEQQAYAGPESAVAERSLSMEPLLPRKPSQPLMKPVVKQPISTGPKSVATEGDTSTEQLPPRHWSIVRHKVQQMMSSSEKAAVRRVSGRRLPPEYPLHFSIKSKVEKISSHLENTAVEGGTSKKSQPAKCPSQSFVKFMAQHIFSDNPDTEEQVSADHLTSNQPSKSLLRPNVEHQVVSGWKSADIEGGISSKLLPTKCALQSLERPKEDPQEVFSYSENDPVKYSCPQKQLPPRYRSQSCGKLEYEKEVSSVSEISLKEWKCSEEHLASKRPFQAEGGAEFQPQIFSTGSVGVPVEWSSAEAHLSPRNLFKALADPGCQQQVYSSSVRAAAKGTIFESNPSSWSLPRGPASPSKTRKRSQGSEDPIKNIPTPTTKPVKFTSTPDWPTSTSGDTYSKVEVLESCDRKSGNSNLSTREADVKNIFGVQLRKIPSSQKYKSKEQYYFTKIPSLSLGQMSSSVGKPQIRSASLGHLGIAENRTATSDVAEKQQSKPKSDIMPKKQPDYKITGKVSGYQFDYATSEPAWISMAKEKQKNFPTQVLMKELKMKSRVGAKASTTVPRYEGADLANQKQQRDISTSNVNRQEKMAQGTLPTSTKAGSENQKTLQVPATRKETRQPSVYPAMFPGPGEPVWLSMAKNKAKAWSHRTDMK